jgi:acyl-CoA synthetase (AMP-forming)/AMP-acid ligase II
MTTSSAASQRAALIERVTAPGQPFEMGERTVRGVPMRVYTTGPLTLRDIALGHVADRIKDVVIRGGENIYCAEVEAALSEHPAIVVPRDGARLAAADAQRHVAGRLASFKVPAHVVFRSAPLPRTRSGKVLKRDLRSAIASELRDG